MPRKISEETLNASVVDIMNVIRLNASPEYKASVPEMESDADRPAVGSVLYGHPALANEWLNALINRIAVFRARSMIFNNPYARFKKGFIEFGETIEEVFVEMAKAREFSVAKAAGREFQRTAADVRSAFHVINWKVQYPITIQRQDIKQAFSSADGVIDLIERIINSVYQAAEYDEFLLFKYLLIKAYTKGKMKQIKIGGAGTDDAAIAFRGTSNLLGFPSTMYNEAGVHTTTPRADQYIFMDSTFNAQYDVMTLASAFNMDKATFMGQLMLIDSFTTFDNDRFNVIRENSDMLEEVTDAELQKMKNVKAILCDSEWFQVYDNLAEFSNTRVNAGLYDNYFYTSWKTVSYSPFSNIVAFVTNETEVALPESITVTVTGKTKSAAATVLTLDGVPAEGSGVASSAINYTQTGTLSQAGIGVQKYGAILIPADQEATEIEIWATIDGQAYKAAETIAANAETSDVGKTVTLNKEE